MDAESAIHHTKKKHFRVGLPLWIGYMASIWRRPCLPSCLQMGLISDTASVLRTTVVVMTNEMYVLSVDVSFNSFL